MNSLGPPASERSNEVFRFLDELINGLPAGAPNKDLLRIHLYEGRRQANELPLPSVEIPFLVSECVGTEHDTALPVAAACALVYLGADLLDNIADKELLPVWLEEGPARAMLAATTYLGPLLTLALSHLQHAGISARRVSEVSETLALGLIRMGSGQTDDLASEADVSEAAALSIAEAKTGAQLGSFAGAAALLGSDEPTFADVYADIGCSYGMAVQLATDLQDLWEDPSHDLLDGRRTLPVVHTIEVLDGHAQEKFIRLLAQARESEQVHDQVRSAIREAGTMRYVAFVVETYCQRSKRLLRSVAPREPGGSGLQDLLSAVSLLPRTG